MNRIVTNCGIVGMSLLDGEAIRVLALFIARTIAEFEGLPAYGCKTSDRRPSE